MPAYMTTVAAPASYAATPDVNLPFEPNQLVFHADSGDFLWSFDGVGDHGFLKANDGNLTVFTKRKKVWFKQSGGAATARLMAFSES